MINAVRKVVGQMQSASKEDSGSFDVSAFMDKVKILCQAKATKEEIVGLESSKASKIDQEMTLRWIDLLHKMVKSIMQIYSMKLKAEIDMTGIESENLR